MAISLVTSVLSTTSSPVQAFDDITAQVHTAVRRGKSFYEARGRLPWWPHKPTVEDMLLELWPLTVQVPTSMAMPLDRQTPKGSLSSVVEIDRYGPPFRALGRIRLASLLLAIDKAPLAEASSRRHSPPRARAAATRTAAADARSKDGPAKAEASAGGARGPATLLGRRTTEAAGVAPTDPGGTSGLESLLEGSERADAAGRALLAATPAEGGDRDSTGTRDAAVNERAESVAVLPLGRPQLGAPYMPHVEDCTV